MKHFSFLILIIFIQLLGSCIKSNQPSPPPHKDNYEEKLIQINKYLIEKDQRIIEDYVKTQGWNMKRDSAGMWFEILKQGSGPIPKDGNVVKIEYKVWLLNGKLCYSSDSTGLISFRVNHSNVIRGLNDAVQMLHLGGEGRFIFPPYMAYGLLGDQKCIPTRSIVVYYIKLVEIK